jgi:starch-binding outer membrane protein, SusD/RagB family
MNNNKYIKLILIALTFMFGAGCGDDFLEREPLDQRTESDFYRTESDAMEALVAVYDVLQWNTVQGFHPFDMLSDILSDDAYAGGASRTDAPNIIEMDLHNIRTTNPEVHGLWRKYYMGIYRANKLLENLPNVEAPEAFKDRVEAEAKFLRAYFYFDLVRLFENVPLVTKTLKTQDEYNQPQAQVDDVYKQIASDLFDAMQHLPAARLTNGRISKWAANALMGRVFLFYNGVYGKNLIAGSTTIDRAKALEYLEAVIKDSGHDLLLNYADNFTRANEFSQESIFEISFSDARPWWDWGYIQGGEGNIGVQMRGPRVDEPAKEIFERGWSFSPVRVSLVNEFASNDKRLPATVVSEKDLAGKLTIGFQHTGYFNRKYTTVKEYRPSSGQLELNWGNNYRVIRFSDVLLMAAELHVLANSPDKAKPYLDRVRARAGVALVPATLENIYKERRLELALEGIRYWDLLRKGVNIANQAITVQGQRGPLYVGDQADFDITFSSQTRGFLPIPQSEIDISNGLLEQNTGYR